MNEVLERAIEDAALDLPLPVMAGLAAAVEGIEAWSVHARNRMSDVSPAANVQTHAVALSDGWKAASAVTGAGLAIALRAAAAAASRVRDGQHVEIAWTGPAVGTVNARSTRQAFIETVRAARNSLLCLSFAAYEDELILKELRAAADRGVTVSLILESTEESKGGLSVDAQKAFESLGAKVTFFVWPADLRPRVGKGVARLHAKAVISDHHVAFVTSANLTGAAVNDNIELGLVVTGGSVPLDLARHVRELIDGGVLRPMT